MKKYLIIGIMIGITHALSVGSQLSDQQIRGQEMLTIFAGDQLSNQQIENAGIHAKNLPTVTGKGCTITVAFLEEIEQYRAFLRNQFWVRHSLLKLSRQCAIVCIQDLLKRNDTEWEEIIRAATSEQYQYVPFKDQWNTLSLQYPPLKKPSSRCEVFRREIPPLRLSATPRWANTIQLGALDFDSKSTLKNTKIYEQIFSLEENKIIIEQCKISDIFFSELGNKVQSS